MTQNNRQYHRQWLGVQDTQNRSSNEGENRSRLTQSTRPNHMMAENAGNQSSGCIQKCGIIGGFEYAIQPDGASLAEQMWERGSSSVSRFRFFDATDQDVNNGRTANRQPGQKVRLRSIESTITQSSQYFQRKEMLPPPPPKQPLVSEDKSSTTATRNDVNLETAARKSNNHDGKSPEVAPFSPPLRVRNRHNAVYGQHLPNSFNSPACAAKVFGKNVSQREEMNVCSNLLKGCGLQSAAIQNQTHAGTQQQQQKTTILLDGVESEPVDFDFDYTPSPQKNGLPHMKQVLDPSRGSDADRDNRNGTYASFANDSTERSFEDDDDALFASIDLDSIVAEHQSKSAKKPQNPYSQLGTSRPN